MKRALHFALIGCGMIAQWYADGLAAMGEGSPLLWGAADLDACRAKTFGEKNGVKSYDSIAALLEDPMVDVVCVCTPDGTHGTLAITALTHGKHVLVEKPLALTVDECDRMIREADKRGLCAGVISQRRFSQTVQTVREVLRNGLLGTLVGAELFLRPHITKKAVGTGPLPWTAEC